jgi:hypothetical protein
MRQKIELAVLLVALTVVGTTPRLMFAQVSLEDQLKAQYTMAKMGSDSGGWSVVQEGTLLAVQKGGIVGVPYKSAIPRTSTYLDGTVHSASSSAGHLTDVKDKFCGVFKKCPGTPGGDTAKDEMTTHLFKVGDKVYPTKIEVNPAKDTVTMGIVACDTCNQTDPPTYNKAQVVFQFASGTLAKTGASQVEDVIAQLLNISTDDQQQSQGGDQGGGQQGNQGGGGGQAQQQSPPPEPQQIEKGQTPDQVKTSLGTPDKIVNLGPKQIYVYKDLKVTFLNGKVSDVQ